MKDSLFLLYIFAFFIAVSSWVSSIIVSLFLIQLDGLEAVLQYRFMELIPIIPGALLATYLIDTRNAKVPMSISIILQIGQTIALLVLQEGIQEYLLPLAISSGLSAVLLSFSLDLFIRRQLTESVQYKYYSNRTILGELLAVGFPLVSGVIIVTLGYMPFFAVNMLLLTVSLYILFSLTEDVQLNEFRPLGWMEQLKRPELPALWKTNFFWGLEFIMISLLVPIIILSYFGSELAWGIISGVIAFCTVFFTFFTGKYFTKEIILVYLLMGFVLSGVSLAFAASGSYVMLLVFLLGVSFWQASQSFGLSPNMNNMVSSLPGSAQLETEYAASLEIPFLIGRVVALGLLYFIHQSIEEPAVLGVVLVLFSLIPMYEVFSYVTQANRKRNMLAIEGEKDQTL